jgi:hypothetical protein
MTSLFIVAFPELAPRAVEVTSASRKRQLDRGGPLAAPSRAALVHILEVFDGLLLQLAVRRLGEELGEVGRTLGRLREYEARLW